MRKQSSTTTGSPQSKRKRRRRSPQEAQERKERVLTQGTPSVVRSIADAIVIKDEDVFFLAKPDGAVPLRGEHGYGLYYHDCRFLSGYELRLAGTKPNSLVASAARGFMAVFQLSNPDLRTEDGKLISKEQIGIKWNRMIDAEHSALEELLTFQNFGLEPVDVPVSLTFEAAFDDVFAVRGLLPERNGYQQKPAWRNGILTFVYEGSDRRYRSLGVQFSPPPDAVEDATVHFRVSLQPREQKQVVVTLDLLETSERGNVQPKAHRPPNLQQVEESLQLSVDDWLGRQTRITSDSLLLNRVLQGSLRDLRALRSRLDGLEYFAAGSPGS